MTFRAIILAGLLVALGDAPAAAWNVGHNIGVVRLDAGSTICDTIKDAVLAIAKLYGEADEMPTSCGYLVGTPIVMIKIIDHRDIGSNTFAILQIGFFPPSNLGIQYGWTLDNEGINI